MKNPLRIFAFLSGALFWPLFADTSERNLPAAPALNGALVEQYIVYYTNVQRVRHGLPLLRRDPALTRAAMIHSQWQALNHNMSHFEPVLHNPVDRVAQACKEESDSRACMARMQYVPGGAGSYRACCSENVIVSFDKNTENVLFYQEQDEKGPYRRWTMDGIHFRSEAELAHYMVYRWMKSPGHRGNILDPENAAIGSYAVHGSGDEIYGTQVFAPHARRGIPSRDYAMRNSAAGEEFHLDIVPGPALSAYTLRAVNGEGRPDGLTFAKHGDAWRLDRPAGNLPAVVRFEVEDDTGKGFFHPLCQVRIAGDKAGQIGWSWESWEEM